MKKKQKLNLKGLFLLLVYLIGSSPFVLFHHHENEIIAYQYADSCQKAVYYGETDTDHHHSSHLSKIIKDCPLCDYHNLTTDIPHSAAVEFFLPEISKPKVLFISEFRSAYFHSFFSRGPPALV